MAGGIFRESFRVASEWNCKKLELIAELGVLDIILLLKSKGQLSSREMREMLFGFDLSSRLSEKTVAKVLRLLSRCNFVESSDDEYRLTSEGDEVIEWVFQSPLDFVQRVALCDKCFRVDAPPKVECITCKAPMLPGFLFRGIFVEIGGPHLLPLRDLQALHHESLSLQRAGIRLFFLHELEFYKRELRVDQVLRPDLVRRLEESCGKYDSAIVDGVLASMADKNEIFTPRANTVATKLDSESILAKTSVKCKVCGTPFLLSPLAKDSVRIEWKPANEPYVCRVDFSHVFCYHCFWEIELQRNLATDGWKCPICSDPFGVLDFNTERKMVLGLFPF